ncbi:MAG: hypothetical protein HYS17_00960 [Micavibrio aeruginosavorus]|uniref:Ribosomal protein S1 n=1 Tax=Micavibrio aeruginosavorus TaxID=349221 RepID=A0A7T5UI75_9BACT|nr:MAG: hypothetical protein HYS17_00960 [Micavibrio aeruginosavorus]
MKVTVNVDCTPEEARAFIGLPNIAPLQERMMKELENRMAENLQTLDPETFMKTWLPLTMESWGEMQKMFWSQMQMGMTPSAGVGEKNGK